MEIRDFKDNIYEATQSHGKNMMLPMMVAVLLTSIIFAAVIVPLVSNLFPPDLIEKFASLSQNFKDIEANQRTLQGLVEQNMTAFLTIYFAVVVLFILTSAYIFRFGYQMSKNQLEGELSWSSYLYKAFDGRFIRTLVALLIIAIIYLGVFMFAGNLARFGVIAFFIGMLAALAFIFRFALVAPAITIADLSLKESFQFSLKHISWGKGFKMVFILFVALLAVFIVLLLVTLIVNLALGKTMAASVINNFIMMLVAAYITALAIAGSAGLFYRYGSFDDPNAEEEGIAEVEVIN